VLNLTTLEMRATRGRGDMLQVYKILMGIDSVKKEDLFETDEGRGRGHSMKLFKKRVRLDIAKYGFGNRVSDQWNKQPAAVVSSQGIGTVL